MATSKAQKDIIDYKTALDTLAGLFKDEVYQYISETWAVEQDVEHLDKLEESSYLMSARILEIGDLAADAIEVYPERECYYEVCFNWADDAKAYLLLWRNIMFEEKKALLLVSEGKTSMENFHTLKASSKSVVKDAADEIISSLYKQCANDNTDTKQVLKYSLQTNPWSVYKTQISSLAPQSEELVKQFKRLWNASGIYVLIKSNFIEDFDHYRIGLDKFKIAVNEIAASLEFAEEIDSAEVFKKLNLLNEEHLSDRSFQDLQKDLASNSKGLPGNERYSIQLVNNKLHYEEIDLKQRTRTWLDSEILPFVNNFYAIRSNIKNQFNLSLSNIKNRLGVEREEGITLDNKLLFNALTTFIKRLAKSEQQISIFYDEVKEQLKLLNLHQIYEGNFLNLSIASTINQYNKSRIERFQGVKNWIADKGIFVRQFQDSVEEEERLSVSEKLVRVINARKPSPGSSHYTNMFMTKGYIGSSFMVGRDAELNHINALIQNWNEGFRGAILITGTRFSGKTLLSEVVAQRQFPDKTIKLVAGKKLQIAGRHLEPTYNLSAQLDFVVKYSLQDKSLVLIDDLHLWNSEEYALLSNLRAMTKIVDKHSNKLFFMVCVNNWLKDRLQNALHIDSVFQAEINTDRISLKELHKAILIRHSATHTEIVDADGEELSSDDIFKLLKQIYAETDGNIGESLMRWAQDISMYNDDKVVYKFSNYPIPQFLNSSLTILLKTIITFGSTNEYNLRRLFGPAFTDEYKPILQRLVNVGVVERTLNGQLEIRQSIINDIAALLAEHSSFTYLKKSNQE